MNLYRLLQERLEKKGPVRVGLVGAGKFASMFLAQAASTRGLHVAGIADLKVERARECCLRAGWPEERLGAPSLEAARDRGATFLTEDPLAVIDGDGVDVVIEATGNPQAGIRHALASIAARKHAVMVNVEADVLAGPLLARKAREGGVVYSLAYGDQPALICELVDWARASGFAVACAGKGTRYHPQFHSSTPETVWNYFGWDAQTVARSGANPKMFNSFIDGTKAGIEMAAVCNATALKAPPDGLGFPPVAAADIAKVCKPREHGGSLPYSGTVEVISSLNRDMSAVSGHLQVGVFVVFESGNDYVRQCFREYWLLPDETARYACLYRPLHLIGLELGISVLSVALRGEPTGSPIGWHADVAATAKRDLRPGETLDGEGGSMVWGKVVPAAAARRRGALPIGLAANVRLQRKVALGETVCWDDVEIDRSDPAVAFRLEMEAAFPAG